MAIALNWSFCWLYIGLIVGHAALGLAFLSRLHGMGLSPHWMTRIEIGTLFLPLIVAGYFGWLILFAPVPSWPSFAIAYAALCCFVAFVGLPAVTYVQQHRRLPAGCRVAVELAELPNDITHALEFVGEGHRSWMLRLRGNESLSLEVKRVRVTIPGLPDDFSDLNILQISDTHFIPAYRREYFEWITQVAASAGAEADLVVFTGDLLDDPSTLAWTKTVLGGLKGRLGQYAILGNHDIMHRPGKVRKALRSAGFTIVDGRWISLEHDGRSVAIGGTSWPWGPRLNLANRPEADVTVVLSHSPDLFPKMAHSHCIDVVLSGHTHGGQIRLPLFGPLVMPCWTGRTFDRGLFKRGRTVMYVNQGVGGKHPLRYNCPPEITILTLARQSNVSKLPSDSMLQAADGISL